MVCLGNICRSPLAHGIMQHLADKHHLNWKIDSAGTGDWHIGKCPDHRSIDIARKHGIELSDQRAQQFKPSFFEEYNHILVMDRSNLRDVLRLAETDEQRAKVQLFLGDGEVADPYYEDDLFVPVFSEIHARCEWWIQKYVNTKNSSSK